MGIHNFYFDWACLYHLTFRKQFFFASICVGIFICIQTSNVNAQTPSFVWAKQMSSLPNDPNQSPAHQIISNAVAVDASGYIYTTGVFYGTADFDPGPGIYNLSTPLGINIFAGEIFVSKLDPLGNFVWAKQMTGIMPPPYTSVSDEGRSISIDASGNIIITGNFTGTNDFDPGPAVYNLISSGTNNPDIFIAKLDATGNFVWAKQFGSTFVDGAYSVALDAVGNVYTTGYFFLTVDFDPGPAVYNLTAVGGYNIFVSKLDAAGNFIFAKQIGSGSTEARGQSIKVDASGNIYTTGMFFTTGDFDPGAGIYNLTALGDQDIFVSKLDASGNFLWAKQMGGANTSFGDAGSAISVDAAGNIYTTGYFSGTSDFDPGPGVYTKTALNRRDAFVSKLDAGGNFLWVAQFGGTGFWQYDDMGYMIKTDASNNVYTIGYFNGTVDFDPGPGNYYLSSPNNLNHLFISKLDAFGNFVWATDFILPNYLGNFTGYGFEVDNNLDLFITGYFLGTVDFDPGTAVYNMTATGEKDVYLAKYTQSCTTPITPAVNITANPVGTICTGTSVTFTATASNLGGGTVNYDFKVNAASVQNSASNTFTTSTLANGNTVTCDITISGGSCLASTTASSNTINMLVNPILTPTVNITSNPQGAICAGTSVTFTATPTNGGNTPAYQWKVNGINVGTNAATYSSALLLNGDIVNVILTSNANCVLPATVTSNSITMLVNPILTPAVNIMVNPSGAICAGTSVTFTATPINGGSTPVYQWKVNGINVGTNSPTFSSSSLLNGDIVNVILTSNANCVSTVTATSNNITMLVNPILTPAVNITANPTGAICAGTSVTFTATPTNGGNTPAYQWKINGINVGTNSPTYNSASLLNGDIVNVILTSNENCVSPANATSNSITMLVNPILTPAVNITANPPGPICTGTSVIFTSTPTNGGSTPAYQWKVNAINVGTNSPTYTTSTLSNADVVQVVLTSNATCALPTIANSNTITMSVIATLTPAVGITASATTICAGTSVTFMATPTNGGSTPIYQWKVNGVNVGTNSAVYTSSALANGDLVNVNMTSSLTCASPISAYSNTITIVVIPNLTPTVNITASPPGAICAGTSVNFTATTNNTGGGTVNYDFKVNGTSIQNGASNIFTSSTLANGNTVSCDITIASGNCLTSTVATSNIISMVVNSNLTPTVNITANPAGNTCSGTAVTFTAVTSNTGGGVLNYDFKVNGTSIQNGASNTFTSLILTNGNTVTCDLTVTGGNCMASTTASSNTLTMNVTVTLIPSVGITASATTVCSGTSVSFTATPTSGGSSPSYQWQVNGINTGTNAATFTSASLNNTDIVKVILTSNAACASPTTATSNSITMVVNPNISPVVNITANPSGTICAGTSVIFTAAVTNSGGGTINYNFKVNGTTIQNSASNTFSTATLANGNTVSCDITITGGNCLSITTASSNIINSSVNTKPTLWISANPPGQICAGRPVTFTAIPSNAGTPPSFQWQVNGINAGVNSLTYINNNLADGDKVSCIMNTVSVCSITPLVFSDTVTMIVRPIPVITFNPIDPTIPSGSSVHLNASVTGNIADYTWTPSTGLNNTAISNPVANPTATTVYKLNVISTDNCIASKNITVTVFSDIYIPNSFSPNGDGINDIFRIPPGPSFTLQYFLIYDRYGNEIFRTTDINKGWDGTYKGAKSPNGTYTYLIKGYESKRQILLNGTVLIVR